MDPLTAAVELRSYRELHRANELILANPDDEFYSAALRLPGVRYYLLDPSNVVAGLAPHCSYLGGKTDTLKRRCCHLLSTISRWLALDLKPAFSRFLRIWSAIITERCCPPVQPNAMVR